MRQKIRLKLSEFRSSWEDFWLTRTGDSGNFDCGIFRLVHTSSETWSIQPNVFPRVPIKFAIHNVPLSRHFRLSYIWFLPRQNGQNLIAECRETTSVAARSSREKGLALPGERIAMFLQKLARPAVFNRQINLPCGRGWPSSRWYSPDL